MNKLKQLRDNILSAYSGDRAKQMSFLARFTDVTTFVTIFLCESTSELLETSSKNLRYYHGPIFAQTFCPNR